jgi:hypothetical protein
MPSTEQQLLDLQTQVEFLSDQINGLVESISYAVTGREFSAAVSLIEKDQKQVTDLMNVLNPKVQGLQKQTNSVALRFRRYASNEKIINEAAEILPTQDEKAALVNAFPPPSGDNPIVTSGDPRLVDDRFPLPHTSTHSSGEIDELHHDSLNGSGPLSHAQINDRIVIIEAKDVAQDVRLDATEAATTVNADDIVALNADTLPEADVKRIPTKAELDRIVDQYILDRLIADVPPPASNDYLLTKSAAEQFFAPLPPPASNDPGNFNHNLPVYLDDLGALTTSIIPANNGMNNLGSPTKAFNKVYAKEFIDVDGNSIVIKDKHLGYNHTDRLRFGGDLIILDTDLQPHIEDISKLFDTSSDLSCIIGDVAKESAKRDTNIKAALDTHASSSDHDTRYFTKKDLANMVKQRNEFFKPVTFTEDITSGAVDLPWKSLVNVPKTVQEIGRLDKFKGVVSTVADLPTKGLFNGDVYMVSNDNGLTSLYSVIDRDRGEFRKSFRTDISHQGLTNRMHDEAHPQYALKESLSSDVFSILTNEDTIRDLRKDLGIKGLDEGKLLSGTKEANLEQGYVHSKKEGNPHNLTISMINGIENENNVIKVHHLSSSIDTSVIPDSLDKRYLTDAQVKAIADTADSLENHADNKDIHLTASNSSSLLSGNSTTLHHHLEDRDLTKSTGILPFDRLDTSAMQSWAESLEEHTDLVSKSHEELHTLESHTDTSVTGTELNALQSAHGTINDAHNRRFAGHGKHFGILDSVSRSDHSHENEYLKRAWIDDKMQSYDEVGTIRSDEQFLYIKKSSGWKKVSLTDI